MKNKSLALQILRYWIKYEDTVLILYSVSAECSIGCVGGKLSNTGKVYLKCGKTRNKFLMVAEELI
jgi:hypothetical protein